ncbi:histidine phosphatase family protein [Mesorhizobium sp. BR1-1-16]|uniref:histidine phosphatase family protein n=1 Tax=Mesorhizobium sp. BR1-1-16 TaxID=2876653 RepID=UPI001CCC6222|nr:histidine phosphatase family protein [Mesorhizobium sp. BR1-1-16]MBZ9936957.1 histidine phosphatase family protein [Mesorhizobium sp. BR1-1-16]
MTTVVYLVRHAAHDALGSYLAGRSKGVVLGPDGLAQAGRLAERMRNERFGSITSSPQTRTQQTAAAISSATIMAPIDIDDDLDEVDFGDWSGKTFEELNGDPAWRRWNEERGIATTPTGESMEHVRKRVSRAMRVAAERHPGESVVLVSHADVIKCAVCDVLGLQPDSLFRFEIDPASITTIAMGSWGSKLLRMNEGV